MYSLSQFQRDLENDIPDLEESIAEWEDIRHKYALIYRRTIDARVAEWKKRRERERQGSTSDSET